MDRAKASCASKAASEAEKCLPIPQTDPALSMYESLNRNPQFAYSGTSMRIALPIHARVGQGFNVIADTVRGTGMETPSNLVTINKENAISYDMTYISNYEQLAKLMNLNVSASYSGFTGGFSASMNLFHAVKFSSTRAYVLVRMTVVTGTESLAEYKLSPAAQSALEAGSALFDTTYGDSFIANLTRGAQLYAVMEFSASSDESTQQLRISVSGHYGGFHGSSDFENSINSLTTNRNVRVLYAQTGGGTGRVTPSSSIPTTGGVLVMSPEELLGRVREFPSEARKDPARSVVLWGEVLDYGVAENCSSTCRSGPELDEIWALRDLGNLAVSIDEDVNTAEDVITNPDRYVPKEQDTAASIQRYGKFLQTELSRIMQTTIAYPAAGAQLVAGILPSQQEFAAAFMKGGAMARHLVVSCPATWVDYRIVRACLFGNNGEPYRPVERGKRMEILTGETTITNCRGDVNDCSNRDLTVTFDPSHQPQFSWATGGVRTRVVYSSSNPPSFSFNGSPEVGLNILSDPWNLNYMVTISHTNSGSFDIHISQGKRNGDGNFGWIGPLVIRWTAYGDVGGS